MINELISHFTSITSAKLFLEDLESLTHTFTEEYMKDGNAQDALIDSVIDYLQTLKTKKG